MRYEGRERRKVGTSTGAGITGRIGPGGMRARTTAIGTGAGAEGTTRKTKIAGSDRGAMIPLFLRKAMRMANAVKGGAAIHVSETAGETEIVMTPKGSGIVTETVGDTVMRNLRTTTTAGIELPTEIEVIGTEIGVDHHDG